MVLFTNPIYSQDVIPGHPKNSASTFSQNDTGFFRNVLIKLNPTLILTGMTTNGEYGGIIQFPIERTFGQNGIFKNMDAYVGGGYNQNFDSYTAAKQPNGIGYTVRGGIYCYIKKKKYLSFQFFYRLWNIRGIYDKDYTPDGSQDNIINPSEYIGGNTDTPIQNLENATVNIYSGDVVYGKQYRFLGKSGRLFFEWYMGVGLRFKTIRLEELGYYDPGTYNGPGDPGTYYPLNNPKYFNESEIFPDVKLGVMVGFAL